MVASYVIVVKPVPRRLHPGPDDADERGQKLRYKVDWFRAGIEV